MIKTLLNCLGNEKRKRPFHCVVGGNAFFKCVALEGMPVRGSAVESLALVEREICQQVSCNASAAGQNKSKARERLKDFEPTRQR